MFLKEWSRSVIVSAGAVDFVHSFYRSGQVQSLFLQEWFGLAKVFMGVVKFCHNFCLSGQVRSQFLYKGGGVPSHVLWEWVSLVTLSESRRV